MKSEQKNKPESKSTNPEVNSENHHPLDGGPTAHYVSFPPDTYSKARIIGYLCAKLPPSKLAETDDPVPSVRFLFAGHVKNAEGELVITRKWTEWLRISYHVKAKMSKLFADVKNLKAIVTDDETVSSALWNTPFKVLVETENDYQHIIRIKLDEDKVRDPSDDNLKYDLENFVPYKYVKAFGQLVPLDLAVLKTPDGIKRMEPDEFKENPDNDD